MAQLSQSASLTSLDYTYAWSKLQCWAPAYPIHIWTAYLTIAAGLVAMLTRLHPRMYSWHWWAGRLYLVGMLWSMSASLLIFNTGLPVGVVISFLWVMSGLTIGLFAISLHQLRRRRMLEAQAAKFNNKSVDNTDNEQSSMEHQQPTLDAIAMTQSQPSSFKQYMKSIWLRMFSWKSLHGCTMFVSWVNLAGRIFSGVGNDVSRSNSGRGYECFTYPIYKPVDSQYFDGAQPVGGNGTFVPTLLPEDSDQYPQMPWANREWQWAALLSVGPLVGAFLIGCLVVLWQHWRLTRQRVQLP